MAREIEEKHYRLHVMINNAGTFEPKRELTEDGLETTFVVNYLAPFLLTNLLFDLRKKSAPSRIVNVASIAHWNSTGGLEQLSGRAEL
jgi:NAD(P)-dependent dehydrogenase (short-subunit alcohol dehydrogenase family)